VFSTVSIISLSTGISEFKPGIKSVVPTLFEGINISVSRKAMVASVFFLQNYWVPGSCWGGELDNNKHLHGYL
jgi:hypothetical protein